MGLETFKVGNVGNVGNGAGGLNNLVYTTDKGHPMFANNLLVDPYYEQIGLEAKQNMTSEIISMHKSKRKVVARSMADIGGTMKAGKAVDPKKIKDMRIIVDYLVDGGKSFSQILKKVFVTAEEIKKDTNVKYIQNLLQRMKHASEFIIHTKNGTWQIHHGYQSGADALYDKVVKDYSKIWAVSKQNKIEKGTTMANEDGSAKVATTRRGKGDKQEIIIDDSKPIELTIKKGNIEITIKIG